jgi:hypothetical protein
LRLARWFLSAEVPALKRRRFCAATLASNAVPSVNLTPVTSFIVSTVLSALYVQLLASHGIGSFVFASAWSSVS